MRLFWKILSELYCQLVSLGFKLSPPRLLFNQPKQKFQCQYFAEILADKTFDDSERVYILEGIKDIEEFCNGMIELSVKFDLEPGTQVADNAFLLLKVETTNPAIVASDERINSTTLGLCQYLQSGGRIIYLVYERLTDPVTYRTTMSHEVGHFLGLEHTARVSIMHKSNFGTVLFPTYIDAQEFSNKYDCSPEDLKYFKL